MIRINIMLPNLSPECAHFIQKRFSHTTHGGAGDSGRKNKRFRIFFSRWWDAMQINIFQLVSNLSLLWLPTRMKRSQQTCFSEAEIFNKTKFRIHVATNPVDIKNLLSLKSDSFCSFTIFCHEILQGNVLECCILLINISTRFQSGLNLNLISISISFIWTVFESQEMEPFWKLPISPAVIHTLKHFHLKTSFKNIGIFSKTNSYYDKKSDEGSNSVRMRPENSGASKVVKKWLSTRVSDSSDAQLSDYV